MKKLLLIATILFSPTMGRADEFCKQIHMIAEAAMEMRQLGVPLHDTQAMFYDLYSDQSWRRFTDAVTIAAYKERRMRAERNQRIATQDFANNHAVYCAAGRR